jgi:hypothetical protein
MDRDMRIATVSGSTIAGLLYLGCIVWDALVPAYAMRAAWTPFLPGFRWLSVGTFLLGLVETLIYGALLGWLVSSVPRVVARAVR